MTGVEVRTNDGHAPPRLPRRAAGPLLAVAALVALAVALGACGGGATPQATATVTVSPSGFPPVETATPSATPSGAASTAVTVYLVRPIGGAQPVHAPFVAAARRSVPQTTAVATAAMNALLAGPTSRERAIGMTTAIPSGTTLQSVKISGGVATVDLSSAFATPGSRSAMTARLAQVVYTLTRYPSVGTGVLFKIDGAAPTSFGATGIDLTKPQVRAGYESVTPPIFVDDPAAFDIVTGEPLHVSGTADVFEATFRAKVVAGSFHRTLTVTATSGSGTRGTFVFSVALPAGASSGKLTVWDASAENGAALHTVTIPFAVR